MSKSAQDALKELDIISLNKDKNMYAISDNTQISLFPKDNTGNRSSEALHSSLMAAGFVPGMGNIADAADALLYAAEGEFGQAAWSAAAMIPVLGQFVAGKRALRAAKKSGEEMVTLYRGVEGVDDVDTMVKKGHVVGTWANRFDPGKVARVTSGTGRKPLDSLIGKKGYPIASSVPKDVDLTNTLFTTFDKKIGQRYVGEGGMLLEFEVPVSWVNKHGRNAFGSRLSRPGQEWGSTGFRHASDISYPSVIFTDGLPMEFIKKVHK